MNRRGLLAALTGLTIAGVAGCSGEAAAPAAAPPSPTRAASPSVAPSPPYRPLTLAAGKAALLAVADLPEGWSVQPPQPLAPAKMYCGRPEPVSAVVRVRQRFLNGTADRVASETLRSFRTPAQAAKYLKAMHAALASCPAEGTGAKRATLAETSMRRFGDESYAVTLTYEDGLIFYEGVARVGGDVVLVAASDDIEELRTFMQAALDKLREVRRA